MISLDFPYVSCEELLSFVKMGRINGCVLEIFGGMPLQFFSGACANVGDEYILLCFDFYNGTLCNT